MGKMRLTKTGKIVILSVVLLILFCFVASYIREEIRYKSLVERYNTPVQPVFVVDDLPSAPEHGSDDMEPYIYDSAKANLEAFNSDDREDMLWYIVQKEGDFFKDDATMENLMFIGLILDKSSPNENASKLGYQVYTVCKNVYNDWEPENGDFVQSKLDRISEYIDIFIDEWYP